MRVRTLCCMVGFALATGSTALRADNSTRASEAVSAASLIVPSVAALMVVGSAELVVTGIRISGKTAEVSLKAAGESAEGSMTLSRDVLEGASLAVGSAIKVVSEATGHALIASGKLIAFVPNEIGKALLHHRPVERRI